MKLSFFFIFSFFLISSSAHIQAQASTISLKKAPMQDFFSTNDNTIKIETKSTIIGTGKSFSTLKESSNGEFNGYKDVVFIEFFALKTPQSNTHDTTLKMLQLLDNKKEIVVDEPIMENSEISVSIETAGTYYIDLGNGKQKKIVIE